MKEESTTATGLSKDFAAAISRWWADHLRHGTRDTHALYALSRPDIITFCRDKCKSPSDKVDAFEAALSRLLQEGPDAETHPYGLWAFPDNFVLSVDYNPQNLLARALKLAGLSTNCTSGLPYKTSMTVRAGKAVITAGEDLGYQVYPAEGIENEVG